MSTHSLQHASKPQTVTPLHYPRKMKGEYDMHRPPGPGVPCLSENLPMFSENGTLTVEAHTGQWTPVATSDSMHGMTKAPLKSWGQFRWNDSRHLSPSLGAWVQSPVSIQWKERFNSQKLSSDFLLYTRAQKHKHRYTQNKQTIKVYLGV